VGNPLAAPALWDWRAVAVGGATIFFTFVGPKLTKLIPGTIIGILAGLGTYFGLAEWWTQACGKPRATLWW
jgi:SulP family sulfate permease